VQVVEGDTMEEEEEQKVTIIFIPVVVDLLILRSVLVALLLSVKESHRLIT
jgi:hypothetical protein